MTCRAARYAKVPRRRENKGVALVMVLLLLLVVTLLGLAGMRGTLLQERMAGNVAARGIAFQAAESVLREAEAYAATRPPLPAAGAGCAGGLCGMPIGGAASAWEADGFWRAVGGYRISALESAGDLARYVVEDLGLGESQDCTTSIDLSASGCAATVQRYRVIAYSQLANGSEVILQSRYEVP